MFNREKSDLKLLHQLRLMHTLLSGFKRMQKKNPFIYISFKDNNSTVYYEILLQLHVQMSDFVSLSL